jgi:DNA uptake protein ComE-like DNA-binding protein
MIGNKRAQYIMELREEGFVFDSLEDLNMISFSEKSIRAFKELNIPLAVGVF